MSDFFASLWQGIVRFPYIYFIASAVLIVFLLFSIKKKWLRRIGSITIGKLRLFAPNWVSILRFPIVWGGFITYLAGHVYTGFCIMVFGVALDRLDGKIASTFGDKVKSFPDSWEERADE